MLTNILMNGAFASFNLCQYRKHSSLTCFFAFLSNLKRRPICYFCPLLSFSLIILSNWTDLLGCWCLDLWRRPGPRTITLLGSYPVLKRVKKKPFWFRNGNPLVENATNGTSWKFNIDFICYNLLYGGYKFLNLSRFIRSIVEKLP